MEAHGCDLSHGESALKRMYRADSYEKWGVKLTRDNCGEMITRAELAGLIYRYFPKNELDRIRENASFSDIQENLAIDSLYEAGIIGGYGGLFRPEDSLKRSETAAIFARLADRAKRLG